MHNSVNQMNEPPKYYKSGFECEILLIANCEFLYKTQSKEYAMNITCGHNPFTQTHVLAHDRKHVRVIDLLACMYVQLSIVENENIVQER